MVAVACSQQLYRVVCSINRMSSAQKASLFQNQNWFQTLSLSEKEGRIIKKFFSKNTNASATKVTVRTNWF